MSDLIRITSPGDFVAAIPVLLGFHPEESFVAVRVSEPGDRVKWTIRVDLDSPAAEVSRQLLDLVSRTGAGRFLLAAYTDTPDPRLRLLEALLLDLRSVGEPVQDALVISGGRYSSLLCQDHTCCPPEGRPVPAAPTALEAARVAEGARAVAASRQELAEAYRLRPDLQLATEALHRAAVLLTGSMWERADTAKALLTDLAQRPTVAPDIETDTAAARVMLLLQDVHVRDLTIGALVAGPEAQGPIDALTRIALRAPDDLRPRLAGAAAAALAATGANAVASWSMIDHAGPDSLATLVSAALHACLEPRVLADTFAEAVAVMIANDTESEAS